MTFKYINSTILTTYSNELALKLTSFENLDHFDHLVRNNYYSIILIGEGNLHLKIDLGNYKIASPTAICLSPYQPFMMTSQEKVLGYILHFHSDFFCTYKHQNEIETEGMLFNNFSSVPFFNCSNIENLIQSIHTMDAEISNKQIGNHEILISLLKILIFLINLIRAKQTNEQSTATSMVKEKPVLLQNLVDSIEKNFRKLHSAKDYAQLLLVRPQQLNKVVKSSFDISFSQMINNRIMIEAKRELYLTSKRVKEIAGELGYKDEFYFSRVFKKQVGVSPKRYRQTVGFAKME